MLKKVFKKQKNKYTTMFSHLVSAIGSTTIAILLCVVFTIIVLFLGSLLAV